MNDIFFDELLEKIEEPLKPTARSIMDEINFLRGRLDDLKKLPFIQTKNGEPTKQRPTPAAKQFKELSQQMNSYIKTLLQIVGKTEDEKVVSPLREYFKKIELR